VAHFFRRAFSLIRQDGIFGLLATNTIRQGDTRATGLAAILGAGGSISRAIKRLQWPGEAAVVVSVIHVANSAVCSPILDGRQVSHISAYLVEGENDDTPALLDENSNNSFQGVILLGMGFTFDDVAAANGETEPLSVMEELVVADEHNAQQIKPYIGGEEINNSPTHSYHRYVIDFEDFPLCRSPDLKPWARMTQAECRDCLSRGVVPKDYSDPVAADWPSLLKIVERRVKPGRLKQSDKIGRKIWWRFLRRRGELYTAIAPLERVLALSRVSPQLGIAQLQSGMVYADSTVVFAFDNLSPFAVIQSRPHEIWARFFSSSMKDDLRYAPSDCFETFPFPQGFDKSPELEAVGRTHHDYRAALMVTRNEGMTKTYNRFHDPTEIAEDIQRLRELHAAMDRAVLEAYGWHDLAARAHPIFLDESNEDDHTYQGRLFWPSDFRDEVLARLLALNAERHAEEVRLGIAPGMKGKTDAEEDQQEE
jgi:hypothetical protein